MISIAREILLHDKVRFAITVASLGFAMVMIVYDLGMFFGVTRESVNLIDRAGADLWLLETGYDDLLSPSRLPGTVLSQARDTAGVEHACALSTLMGNLEIGETHPVQIVGIDPGCPLIQPWDVIEGQAAALQDPDTVVVDDLILGRDPARVGDGVELNDRQLRLVAVTRHNKGFTTPYAYVSLETFGALGGPSPLADQCGFVALRLAPDAQPQAVARQLTAALPGAHAVETQPLRAASIGALVAQGVGMIFAVVFIGVLVGMMIITTTIYTATVEHLRSFAILKALGATRWQIWRVVLEQAVIQTAVSFGLGLAASLALNYAIETMSGIRAIFPIPALAASLAALVLLAVLGSLLSIRRALAVDPTLVFRA
jgi:putative ABC transport system permease protein